MSLQHTVSRSNQFYLLTGTDHPSSCSSKGVLCINGQGRTKFVFQGVHEQINFGPSLESWKEDEVVTNKLVFIGRGLDRDELQKGFEACKFTPLAEGWDSAMDDYGRRYYFNKETRATQWTKPV